jgi:hypothetical protein
MKPGNSIVPNRVTIPTKPIAKEGVNEVIHIAFTTFLICTGAILETLVKPPLSRVDSSIIVLKEANDHTFVDVVSRTNIVWERIEAAYHQLRTYNKPQKKLFRPNKDARKNNGSWHILTRQTHASCPK